MDVSKPKLIQDFEKLPKVIQEQIREAFPNGFLQNLIQFNTKDGKLISALPFETDDKYYLVRVNLQDEDGAAYGTYDDDDDDLIKDDASKDEFDDKFKDDDYPVDDLDDDFTDSFDDDDDDDEGDDEDDEDDDV